MFINNVAYYKCILYWSESILLISCNVYLTLPLKNILKYTWKEGNRKRDKEKLISQIKFKDIMQILNSILLFISNCPGGPPNLPILSSLKKLFSVGTMVAPSVNPTLEWTLIIITKASDLSDSQSYLELWRLNMVFTKEVCLPLSWVSEGKFNSTLDLSH